MDRADPDTMFDPEINFVVGKKKLGQIIDKCITRHGFTVAAGVLDAIKASKSALKAVHTRGWSLMARPSTSTGSKAWMPRRWRWPLSCTAPSS